ncbi:MAG: hypothetical protein NC117_03620 [Pseudoflavonifractor sp.]|nr:hypothetical protein [Pseudoflavonifractor sp.]
MNTVDILNKRIALCLDIRARSYRTITLFDALNSIRTGKYKTQIENIRRLYSLGKSAIAGYKSRKKQLPSYIFSGTLFDTRFKFDICGYTSLMIVDIDKLESADSIKDKLKNDSHIVSTWISPSGNGLKALLYFEYDKYYPYADTWIYHEHCAFPQIEKYLRETYDINIDSSGDDVTRLCFVSYDPDIHLKRQFTPFKVSCNLSNSEINKIRWRYNFSRQNIRNALKEHKRIAKLLNKTATKD